METLFNVLAIICFIALGITLVAFLVVSIKPLLKKKKQKEQKQDDGEMKVDLWSSLKVVLLLYFVLIVVGILTYIIKPGTYDFDASGHAIAGTFHYLEDITRLPWYRWLTAPFESLIFNSSAANMYQIIALILILGGCFRVLEEAGAMEALVKVIINKFKNKRFGSIWVITAVMMLLCSFFGVQDELLILFPIMLSFALAMGWSKTTALALVLITTSSGFTCALLNPYTIGTCANLAGINILDGIWFRAIMLVVMYFITSIFMVGLAKKDEKINQTKTSSLHMEISKEERKKANLVIGLFGFALLIVVLFAAVPALEKLGIGLIAMGGAFVIGTIVLGGKMLGSAKAWFKGFFKGIKQIYPSCFIIIVAFSIKYIAEEANILHTLFYYLSDILGSNPYLGTIILLALVLLIEFFIPSATAKAGLIIPLLTVTSIPGISINIIILCYLLGDGYTNVIFPTCGTLMIGLGVADVSYIDWMKKTGLYQILLLILSICFLHLAVLIGV